MQYLIAFVVIAVVGVAYAFFHMQQSKRRIAFSQLPAMGPIPVDAARTFYARATKETATAFEGVKGWDLNETPTSFAAAPLFTHVVLFPRVVDFCSADVNGKLTCEFNFLNGRIEAVEFNTDELPSNVAPEGFGVMRIQTPSGITTIVCSTTLPKALGAAVDHAKAQGWVNG